MIRTDKRLRLCAVLLVGILGFIWGNSLLPAEISQAFSDWVKALLFGTPSGGGAGGGSGLLRKIAHFTEFAALGMALCWLFGMLRRKQIWPLLLGIGAACVDETIQCFVPDRGPGITDVVIDMAGVAVGMILLLSGHNLIRKRTKHTILEENEQ